jgi:hypothetical protein
MISGQAYTRHAKPISDLDIQEWVSEHYGFVPHPLLCQSGEMEGRPLNRDRNLPPGEPCEVPQASKSRVL